MANERILIGQFLGKRTKNPDSANSQFAPGGQIDPAKDFLEQDIVKNLTPELPPVNSPPAKLPQEKAPALGVPSVLLPQPAPPIHLTQIAPEQPHPESPRTHAAPETPHPTTPPTHVAPEQPHPESPRTNVAAEQPHPESPRTVPAGPQPSQFPQNPAVLPAQPAPPLGHPATLPAQAAPPLGQPGSLPVQPAPALGHPAVLPAADPVTLGKPATLPAQPPADGAPLGPKMAPSYQLDPKQDINDIASPGGKQGTALPNFRSHAPGGQIDPARDIQRRLHAADAEIKAILRGTGQEYTTIPIGAPGGAGFSKRPVGAVRTPFGTQGDMALDPILFGKSVARAGAHLGAVGLAIFAAEQLALFSLNNRGRIWNPLMAFPPPLVQNFIKPALDLQIPALGAALGDGIPRVGEEPPDIHRQMAEGKYSVDRVLSSPPFYDRENNIGKGKGSPGPGNGFLAKVGSALKQVGVDISGPRLVGADSQEQPRTGGNIVDDPATVSGPLVVAGLAQRNKYSPDPSANSQANALSYSEHAVPTIAGLVEAALSKNPSDFKSGDHLVDDASLGLRVLVSSTGLGSDKLANIFQLERQKVIPDEWRPKAGLAKDSGINLSDDSLFKSAFANGIIPVKFKADNSFGFIATDAGQSPSEKIPDDEAYVPLSFMDLRPYSKAYRTVFFRPFITNFSEDFSPEWNKQNFYGRTDVVATYQSTGRVIQLGFQIVAFGPEDVKVIYQKLNWLTSMVYPEYDSDLVFRSGPVVRMRVGDVINAIGPEGGRGLPGIIESLNFDYNDAIWELKEDFKVPRNIKVSLTFRVLHDRPIGIGAEGRFGGIGEFKDGKYLPPGQQQSGGGKSSGESSAKFPEIKKGIDSFRLVGGDKANDMNYADSSMDKLKSDEEK